jgi:beta-glucosidase
MKNCLNLLLFLSLSFISMPAMSQGDFQELDPEIEKEISKIISEMSIEEKVGQTCQITLDVILKRNESGNVIEPIQVDQEKLKEAMLTNKVGSILNVGSHTLTLNQWTTVMSEVHSYYESKQSPIPILYGIDAIHGVNYTVGGTLFPQEIGLAATWNEELANKFGHITAYETKASGIPWNFSPVLDIARQPLWSRFFETLGEDPYLAKKLGKSIVDGYQGQGEMDAYHTAACLKHFVGYSVPSSGRDRTPAWIPEKFMQEIFLVSFKESIEAGAMTVMVNSGDVNGTPGHINHHLLTEVLKDEWGFNGFAVSDWEDFIFLETVHQVADGPKDAIIKGFNAGVDMSMVPNSPHYQKYVKLMTEAVNEKEISIERLDDAVRRILRVKMSVGLFDKKMNQAKKYPNFGSQEFKDQALSAALESITLLKNKENILPLSGKEKVLVSGPAANNLIYLNGAWTHTWQGTDTSYNTEGCYSIYEAMKNRIGEDNCQFSPGAELFLDNDYESSRLVDVEDFNSKAAKSDVILLCLGEIPSTEKPGDIRSLDMSVAQIELAKQAYATGKPVIIVLVEARPRIIRKIVGEAAAIFQAYLPGDYGGDALTKLIYGESNPSGKLPYTYPKYNGVIEFYDHPRSVARHKSNHFNAYDPQWDFGFGLSYSNFSYSDLKLNKTRMTQSDTLTISVTVTNTSDREGKEIVQLYISDLVASVVPANKKLKGFQKINLAQKESKIVKFAISIEDIKFATSKGEWISETGEFKISVAQLNTAFHLE